MAKQKPQKQKEEQLDSKVAVNVVEQDEVDLSVEDEVEAIEKDLDLFEEEVDLVAEAEEQRKVDAVRSVDYVQASIDAKAMERIKRMS